MTGVVETRETPPTSPASPSALVPTATASPTGERADPPLENSTNSDSRAPFDSKSKWSNEDRKAQRNEGIYLAITGAIGIVTVAVIINTMCPPGATGASTLAAFPSLLLAFAAGLVGGTSFAVKWWYRSIGRGLWHYDRQAWRVSVPWQSAAVAMFVHLLFRSDLIGILNPAVLDRIFNVTAFGFLVGYFSDSAIAKMAEVSESLFGGSKERSKRS